MTDLADLSLETAASPTRLGAGRRTPAGCGSRRAVEERARRCSRPTARSTAPTHDLSRAAGAGRRGRRRHRGARARAAARRRLPARRGRRPAPVGGRRLRGPGLPRLAAARSAPSCTASTGSSTSWSSRCTRRTATPTATSRRSLLRVVWPDWVAEHRGRAVPATRSSCPVAFVDFTSGLRHPLRGAVPGDRRRARGPGVHLGRDLLRPRGGPVPPGRLAPPSTRCGWTCPPDADAAAGRPGARAGDVRPVGPHPRPRAQPRRPAVRPVHDQAADAVLAVRAGGAALRPHRLPGRRRPRARRACARARLVQYAVVFDRLLRFPLPATGCATTTGSAASCCSPTCTATARCAGPTTACTSTGTGSPEVVLALLRRDRGAVLAQHRPAQGRALARGLRARDRPTSSRTRPRCGPRARGALPWEGAPKELTDAVLPGRVPAEHVLRDPEQEDRCRDRVDPRDPRMSAGLPADAVVVVDRRRRARPARPWSSRLVAGRRPGGRRRRARGAAGRGRRVAGRRRRPVHRPGRRPARRAGHRAPGRPARPRSTASCTWSAATAAGRCSPTTPSTDWLVLHDLLIRTVQNVTLAFHDALVASPQGRFVLVSATAAAAPTAGAAGYAAAKAAAEAWTLALADSFRRLQSGRADDPLPQTAAATVLVVKALVHDGLRAAKPEATFPGYTDVARPRRRHRRPVGRRRRRRQRPASGARAVTAPRTTRRCAASPATTTPASTPRCSTAIAAANGGHQTSYGDDATPSTCRRSSSGTSARAAAAYPVFNGTGANVVSLQAMTSRWASVVCTSTAHIHVDECGAPEKVGGLKLLPVRTPDGKLTPELDRHRGARLRRRAPGPAAGRQHHPDDRAGHRVLRRRDRRALRARARAGHARAPRRRADLQRRRLAGRAAAGVHHRRRRRRAVLRRHQERPDARRGRRRARPRRPRPASSTSASRRCSWRRRCASSPPSSTRCSATDLWLRNATHANAMAQRLEAAVRDDRRAWQVQRPVQANAVFAVLPKDGHRPAAEAVPVLHVGRGDRRGPLDDARSTPPRPTWTRSPPPSARRWPRADAAPRPTPDSRDSKRGARRGRSAVGCRGMPAPVLPARARVVVIGGGVIGTLGRLPPRAHGLEGRRAARARPAHLGHHLARGRPDGHVRLDLGDLDRDAQVHPRPLRAARGRDRPGHRLQAGRLHRGRRRRRTGSRSTAGSSAFNRYCGVDVHEISPREVERAVPARAHRRHPRRLLRRGGRPGQPGRRHDGAGQGRAHAGRDASSRASPVTGVLHAARRGHRRAHRRTATSRPSTSSTAPACGRASSARRPA